MSVVNVAEGHEGAVIGAALPEGWRLEWETVEGDWSGGGTWAVIYSPEGTERGRARTATRALERALDGLWTTLSRVQEKERAWRVF